MAMVRMLFFLGTAFLALAEVSAAPAKYDQRQDGNYNLHAKLENFLFIVAIPNNNELLDLATQTLELKQQLVSQALRSSKEQGSIKAGEEPYTVEIIRVDENHSDKEDAAQKAEEGKTETSDVSNQRLASIDEAEKAEVVERVPKNLKAFEFPKSREVPTTILGYFTDVRKILESKTENGGRARNVVGNVWNPDIEPGRPGTSLKKQLPQTEEEEEEEEDVTPSKKEQDELRLVGYGIENCGPGRRRNSVTLSCENDESAVFV